MNEITAPYNFAPLSDKVFFPAWSAEKDGVLPDLLDEPFDDGICGTLDYEIEALGPLMVRGTSVIPSREPKANPIYEFFRTPAGHYAVPGSSVRGLLRNVVQVATFGKFGPINATRYGFRDLHNPDQYGKYMATLDGSQKGSAAVVPLVGAGWLVKTGEADSDSSEDGRCVARIEPCSFAKIEYGLLERLQPGFKPGRKQSAPEKYADWQQKGGRLEVDVTLRPAIGSRFRPGLGAFSIVQALGGPTRGTLVFTGQPQEWNPAQARKSAGKPKHHDFVFHRSENDPTALEVTQADFRSFEFIHSDTGQQGRSRATPNKEWGHWEPTYRSGGRVPVFYLLEDGRLRSFGLAMMFRLAYEHAIDELAAKNQPAIADRRLDFAETLFGVVPPGKQGDDADGRALKGRVSVGLAVAKEARPLPEVVAVLGAPKPTFYPNYVEQGAGPGENPARVRGKPVYKTYMDGDARLRGWKRYRPQKANLSPPLPDEASEKVKTRFVPLAAGAKFSGRIRLHNVKPEELGALLWAMDFGSRADHEHMLGMARSLGFGRVKLRVVKHDLDANAARGKPLGDADLEAARKRFIDWAGAQAEAAEVPGGWAESAQLTQLLACARPVPEGTKLVHLSLAHPTDRNQFTQAKKDGLALRAAAPWKAPPKVTRPPPPVTVVASLALNPGSGEWKGTATLEGKTISLVGKDVPGITDQQKKKRVAANVTCVVQLVGGNAYRVTEVKG